MLTTSQQILNRLMIVAGVGLVLATGVVFVANDGQSGAAGAQQAPGAAKAADTVLIKDFLFEPAAITVPAGTEITFTNQDSAPHTATSGPAPELRGVFDTGNLVKDQSKRITLSKPGTFAYYCELHAFMKATVTVT